MAYLVYIEYLDGHDLRLPCANESEANSAINRIAAYTGRVIVPCAARLVMVNTDNIRFASCQTVHQETWDKYYKVLLGIHESQAKVDETVQRVFADEKD